MLSLKEATTQTGRSRPALLKAINNGRISAAKNDKGEWRIDPAELFRVYEQVTDTGKSNLQTETTTDVIKLQAENDGLRRELEQIKNERDDLRRRLDSESEERRKLTALLTDRREPERSSFWPRLFGK